MGPPCPKPVEGPAGDEFDIDSSADLRQFRQILLHSFDRAHWATTAKHHLGGGLESGGDFSPARTQVRKYERKNQSCEMGMCRRVVCGGLWCADRCLASRATHYVPKDPDPEDPDLGADGHKPISPLCLLRGQHPDNELALCYQCPVARDLDHPPAGAAFLDLLPDRKSCEAQEWESVAI